MDGWGISKSTDNEHYEGQWKDGLRHGFGMYIWKDGDIYIGEWNKN